MTDPLRFVRSLTQLDKNLIQPWIDTHNNEVDLANEAEVRRQLTLALQARGGGRYWDGLAQQWIYVQGPNLQPGSPTLASPSMSVPVTYPTLDFSPTSPAYANLPPSISFNTPGNTTTTVTNPAPPPVGSGGNTAPVGSGSTNTNTGGSGYTGGTAPPPVGNGVGFDLNTFISSPMGLVALAVGAYLLLGRK